MSSRHTDCDSTQITACLVDSLSASEQQEFELHLEQCEVCRRSLEQQAANDESWEQTVAYLRDDADDMQRLSDGHRSSVLCNIDVLVDALGPTDDPRMLGRLGPYEIAGVIGAGGMGVVLKAFDPSLSRFVAMKVLTPQLWNDERARKRFSREARAAASVVHENVIEIYGVSEANGVPFFTMPYLRGETLQARIDNRGPLEPSEILRIAKQLVDGLAIAHAQGLVHRDIKPANVLLTDGAERVRISDFGLAYSRADDRLTHTGVLAGTPAFMSPEQVNGLPMDQRSDLFSVGSVIHAMCTGSSPFAAETVIQQLMKVSTASSERVETLNPAVPMWLAAIVDRLHSLSPDDRYRSAAALSEDLEKCLAHLQNPESFDQPRNIAKLQTRYERAGHPRTKGRLLTAVGGVTAAVLLTLFWPHIWATVVGPAAGEPITISGRVVDSNGKPLSGATVLAIQKTWPNNRYRQRSLQTKTNAKGEFKFEEFAIQGRPYGYLLTALPDGYAMSSEYKFVEKGLTQEPTTLRVVKSNSITIRLNDPDGKPLAGVKVLPSSRTTDQGVEHFTYAMQARDAGKMTDDRGIVVLSGFRIGDTDAELILELESGLLEQAFEVPEDGQLTLTIAAPRPQVPAAPPVTLSGKVIDQEGRPVAGAKIIVVRKTWPNDRYRQEGLTCTTNQSGEFTLPEFASGKRQYAFLLTVIEEGYAMTSQYRVVRDGSQQEAVTLSLESTQPINFIVQDHHGNPLEGVELCPAERWSGTGTAHINYFLNMEESSKKTNADGKATFTAWKPGETGSFHYRWNDDPGEVDFDVLDDRNVTITLP